MNNEPKANEIYEHPFRAVFVGKSGSGKSQELARILMDEKYNLLQQFPIGNIFIFSPTNDIDPSQQKLIEFLKYKSIQNKDLIDQEQDENKKKLLQFDEKIQVFENPDQYTQRLIQLRDQQKANKKAHNNKPMLIILDDCQGEIDMNSGIIPKLLVKQRHYDISSINLVQSMKGTLNPTYREQVSHWNIYGLTSIEEIKKAQKELAGYKQKQFQQLFQEATSRKYGYLMIIPTMNENYRFFNTIDQQYEL